MRYVSKYCIAGQVTRENMAHDHCMLDILGYKHTLIIYNTFLLSPATIVARMRLIVTLHVHCPSSFFIQMSWFLVSVFRVIIRIRLKICYFGCIFDA